MEQRRNAPRRDRRWSEDAPIAPQQIDRVNLHAAMVRDAFEQGFPVRLVRARSRGERVSTYGGHIDQIYDNNHIIVSRGQRYAVHSPDEAMRFLGKGLVVHIGSNHDAWVIIIQREREERRTGGV